MTRVTLYLDDIQLELLSKVRDRVQSARKTKIVTWPEAAKAAIRAVADQPDVEVM